jgi:phosphoglycolate phosphatase
MPILAVAFDLDGTLLDTLPDVAAASNHMRAHFGLAPLSAPRVAEHIGEGLMSLLHRTYTDQRDGHMPPELENEAKAQFQDYYSAHLSDHTRVFPGCETVLKTLQQRGIPLACITNKLEKFARPLLVEKQLAGYFDIIIGGDTLAERKPHPLPLLHVAAALGVAPADMLMVGDSDNDHLAARAAGSLSALLSHGYGGDIATLKPDYLLDSLVGVLDLFNNG